MDPAPTTPSRGMTDGIGRASAFLASGTIVSRILGFVKAIVLASTIGAAGAGANAFAVANQLPNTIYVVVAGGVLSAVIVPLIVRAATHEDGGAAYINKLITLGIVVLGAATVLATALAPVLTFLVGGTRMSQSTLALAIGFAWWCLPQIFFYGLYSLLGEVLNARRVFGPFTWVPVLNNVVALLGLVAMILAYGADPGGTRAASDWTSGMIALLAGTATLGVASQALILFVFWRRAGLRYRPDFAWRGIGLRHTGKLAGWTFGMLLLTTFAGIVETNVTGVSADQSDQASVAVLQNAWLIFMLPHSVITVSIATAYFTRMSEHAALGEIDRVRYDMSSAVRGVSLIIMIAAAGLMVVAYPFASFFTDDFTLTSAMGNVIIAYVAGLVGFSVLFIAQRTFYALHDTRTPFVFTLVQVVLFTLGALACLTLPSEWTAFGIAVVTTLAGTVQLIVALALLRRRIERLDGRAILASFGRSLAALVLPVAAGVALLIAFGGTTPGGYAISSIVGAIVSMTVIGVVMSALYFAGLWLLRSPELRGFAEPLVSRLRRG
ncbi:murein biosynthesis integral membrane protein MurJ [Agromyces sp. SYSU K20354]|uniref:murein biosynthesis integral membrane protein MurJ n=1 Tax=Agromyces cavernae TaxID=2898659 RepID=UPI001E4FC435|nr:murein biosynthesis integral membrane protein MurJ [Agromyces cavernae]MCD2440870.1 murein biosynthesis integral membrane protein MurJ [Agromyces cavernae]